ncbi:hypothetical protein [Desertibacillus haloalkaliphilus]|uniref:hypothetical protein n=1 Tax=Desertibacillus haloalkaliphilus TaxID=1328930 RepID=UPI001C25988B|nr:hypothetical protein [Desertibacillus haloalkaliphilus]MBU8905717.1 hypothetical protein [Desertibacillus haloalkaliphilus]
MELIIITLFIASCLLFVLSFIKKDRSKEVENQIENFSITLMQEIYQLKKKVRILEEEILVGHEEKYLSNTYPPTETLKQEVNDYYDSGYSIEKIAELTSLAEHEVESLLHNEKQHS